MMDQNKVGNLEGKKALVIKDIDPIHSSGQWCYLSGCQ